MALYASSEKAQNFIDSIVHVIEDLRQDGIEDSVDLGFDLYFESVKKVSNSDILAAITSKEEAQVTFTKKQHVHFSGDATQVVNMSDDEFRRIWKYTYADLVEWCRNNTEGFKQNSRFTEAKKRITDDIDCVYIRRLDNKNTKSASKKFYTDLALEKIKAYYDEQGS